MWESYQGLKGSAVRYLQVDEAELEDVVEAVEVGVADADVPKMERSAESFTDMFTLPSVYTVDEEVKPKVRVSPTLLEN